MKIYPYKPPKIADETTSLSRGSPDSFIREKDKLFGVIPQTVMVNPAAFIACSKKGVPGVWVKHIINATGQKALFAALLDVSEEGLFQVYRRPHLTTLESERVLDATRVLLKAIRVWESNTLGLLRISPPA